MRKMTAQEVVGYIEQHGGPAPFWCRGDRDGRWVLLENVSARGIMYGMASWEFYGPIPDPESALNGAWWSKSVLSDVRLGELRKAAEQGFSLSPEEATELLEHGRALQGAIDVSTRRMAASSANKAMLLLLKAKAALEKTSPHDDFELSQLIEEIDTAVADPNDYGGLPTAWAVYRDGKCWGVRASKPTKMGEPAGALIVPLYP